MGKPCVDVTKGHKEGLQSFQCEIDVVADFRGLFAELVEAGVEDLEVLCRFACF